MTIKNSRHNYSDTVAILKQKITDAGNKVFACIDQTAAATEVGMSLRPTMLLIFGNPKAGTPLMQDFPLVALELPLKILIWDDDENVRVAYVPMSEIAKHFDLTGMDQQIETMDRAVDALTNSVV